MKKVLVVLMALTVSIAFAATSFAAKKKGYAEGKAGAGSITGVVSLKGAAPAPIIEDLTKGKNVEFCVTHPDAKKDGTRARIKVTATGGKLKDAVVFIEEIDGGKPWGIQGRPPIPLKNVILTKKCLQYESPLKQKQKIKKVIF